MNKQQELLDYWSKEGLNKYVNLPTHISERGVFDNVSGKHDVAFNPEIEDLVRLHRMIRERKCFTVLEFGLGFSTLVMADALRKNKTDWESLPERPAIRNRFMFQCFSIDSSEQWIKISQERLPEEFKDLVHISFSEVEIGTFNGQICHYYTSLPDIIPDFVYLDAPHPKDVKGNINGLSFQCDERTVIAADLLLMEPTLLPGTLIVVDGRTNNARFLKNNFKRDFDHNWNPEGDITTFELVEERLGPYNLLGSDFF